MTHNLTLIHGAAILFDAGNKSARNLTPASNGVKTPSHGVFLCLKKIVTAKIRALTMAARLGPLSSGPVSTKPLVAPLPGGETPIRAAAQRISPFGGGFIHAMEIVEMTIQNRATVAPVRLTLPSLFTKTRLAFDLPRPFRPRVLIYQTESGAFDIINQADGKHGVTPEQRAYMLDQIAMHGGIVGGVA